MQAIEGFDARAAMRTGLFAVCYFLLAVASIWLSRIGNGIAGVWFANVFAFAVMLRRPALATPRGYAALALASLAANLSGGSSVEAAALFSLVNLAHVALALRFSVRRMPPGKPSDIGVADFAAVLGLAGGLATAIAAIAFAIPADILFGWPVFVTAWKWFAANALGFALALPVMLSVTRAELRKLSDPGEGIQLVSVSLSCALVACLAIAWGPVSFILAILPLMLVAPQLPGFQMAVVCATTGMALVLIGMSGTLPGIGNGIDAFANGFQLAVAVTVLLPFLAGLLIRQYKADRKRISESEECFRRAMAESPIGVAMVTLDGRLIESNCALSRMLGFAPGEIDGMSFLHILHPKDVATLAGALLEVRDGHMRSYHAEQRCLRKDGSATWAKLSGSVICDQETGRPLYLVVQVEDINETKLAASRLKEAETRWNFALASAGQGVWDLDLTKGRSYYSPDWKKMLGYEDHELGDQPDLWMKLVHPDDQDRIAKADRAHVENQTSFFEAEFRMRHKQGHWIWVLDRGKALERDASGRALRAIGTHTDITRLKEAEQRIAEQAAMLAEEKERLRVTLQSIGDAVICTDGARRITFMNPAAEHLTRVSEEEGAGLDIEDVYVAIDEETGMRLSYGDREADQNARAVLLRRDGTVCSIRQVVSPIVAEGGGVASGSVIVFQDFSDARSLQRELTYAASHDALTGLANRAAFLRVLDTMIRESPVHGALKYLLYIDLDHFKVVNDTSGHPAGDALLKCVADTIGRVLGHRSTLSRMGGDEFAVILEASGREEAEAMAIRVVAAVHAIAFAWKNSTHRIGASIGIAPVATGAGGVDELIARADEACYAAKAAGRGCAMFIGTEQSARSRDQRRSA
ncbi:MAG: PAS domain S-box protein [Rhizobiaceae bacterium]|nr:PAS domain S-box protein [Rhizobiaceae bacterium]